MRWLVVIAVVACSKTQDAPEDKTAKPRPMPVLVDAAPIDAARPPATTPLEEAARLVELLPDPRAELLALLARAQAVAKQDGAKATLERALTRARKEGTAEDDATHAVAYAIDAAAALGDDAQAKALQDELVTRLAGATGASLLSPPLTVEHAPTIERLAARVAAQKELAVPAVEHVVVGSPAWDAIVAAVRALPPAERLPKLVVLASRAVESDPARGAPLVVEAAKDAAKTPDFARMLARLAILTGDLPLAKKLLAVPVAKQPSLAAAEAHADLAEMFAVLGDKRRSLANEKLAIAAAKKVDPALYGSDAFDNPSGEATWTAIGIGRALRDGAEAGIAYAKQAGVDPGAIALGLVIDGKPLDTALAENLRGDALVGVVRVLARRGALADAETRMLASPLVEDEMPGIAHVLREYGLRADAAALEALAPKLKGGFVTARLTGGYSLAAQTLAKRHECAQAIATLKRIDGSVPDAYAIVAYYCPGSKL